MELLLIVLMLTALLPTLLLPLLHDRRLREFAVCCLLTALGAGLLATGVLRPGTVNITAWFQSIFDAALPPL